MMPLKQRTDTARQKPKKHTKSRIINAKTTSTTIVNRQTRVD